MSLIPGNVVGVSIGGQPPIAGLVLKVRRDTPNKEPLIDVEVAIMSVHGDCATPMAINDVPHLDDGPGHYTWSYSGPEVLVRKAVADPGAAGPVVDADPGAASGEAAR